MRSYKGLGLWACDQTETTMVSMKTKDIPSDEEIAQAEEHLAQMKAAREEAKQAILASLSSVDEIVRYLNGEDMIHLMKILSDRLQGGHKKVRGSPVSKELKTNLELALRKGEFSIPQLEKIFNLSSSYISRVKAELGLSRPIHRGQTSVAVN